MYSPNPEILRTIEDSFFILLESSPEGNISQPLSEDAKAQLYQAYKDSMNPNGQYGYSKSQNAIYLKMFKVLFYEKGGHVVLPTYIMNSSPRGIYEEKNMKFKELWDSYNFKCISEEYKGLKQITYNHAFPDGRLIEYVFEENVIFKEQHVEKMYYDTTRLKSYTLLKEEIEYHFEKNDKEIKPKRFKL